MITVFVDRDGVINEEPGPILSVDAFHWIPQSLEALLEIHNRGWRCLIISNQGAVAKGLLPIDELEAIHQRLQRDLAERGGSISGIFYCPHYPQWEPGFIRSLCYPCSCRKPEIGLFQQATQQYPLDYENTFFIGDSSSDFEAAQRMGITAIGVRTGHGGMDGKYSVRPKYWSINLYGAVQKIIQIIEEALREQ